MVTCRCVMQWLMVAGGRTCQICGLVEAGRTEKRVRVLTVHLLIEKWIRDDMLRRSPTLLTVFTPCCLHHLIASHPRPGKKEEGKGSSRSMGWI